LWIVEQIASTDSRIKIVRAPRNLGLPLALNFGLRFCHAPFIARMDGDDIALPTRLEKQLRFLEENQEIDLVGCATSAIDEHGRPIPGLGVSLKPITQEAIAKTALLAPPCSHIWLARREVYDTLSGYREISVAEDYDFLLRAISAGFRITNLPESLMLIRTRSGNISSRLEQRKAHYYIVNLYRERMRNLQDSFSRAGYERAVQSNRVENGTFRLAMRCVQEGLRSHSRMLRYFLLALSALISPWQARYFLLRLHLKLALRTPGF
jgi:glycosyltransferase involved in cell wall biosynthesis